MTNTKKKIELKKIMRDAFNKELINIANQNSNIYLLTGDIGFQVFDEFREKFTNRFLNMEYLKQT